MASSGKKPSTRKQSSKMKTKWVNNALKSVGLAAKAEIKKVMPSAYSVEETMSRTVRDTVKTLRSPKQGSVGKQMKNNKYVKMANTAITNTLNDLKSGNLMGDSAREEAAMESSMMGGDSDWGPDADSFDEWDDWDEEESVTFNYVDNGSNGNQVAAGAATISNAVNKSTQATLTGQQAAIDAMVGVSSNLMYSLDHGFGEANSHLENIDATLTSILEFHQESTSNFYETAIATFEKIGNRLDPETEEYGKDTRRDEDFAAALGGKTLDGGKLKDLLKKNIKHAFDNSSVGMAKGVLSDDMLEMVVANPLSLLPNMFAVMLPKALEQGMHIMDKAFTDFIPNMMVKLGKWQDIQGRGLMNNIKRYVGKIFGVKTELMDNVSEHEVSKEAATFDQRTRTAIVEVLPKYARESTAYLRAIALKVTKQKDDSKILESQQFFNNQTGFYSSKKELEESMKDAMQGTFMDAFSESEFGKVLRSIGESGNLNAKQTKEFNEILPMFYAQIASAKNMSVEDFNMDDKNSAINQILDLLPGKKKQGGKGVLIEALKQMNENNIGIASVAGAQLNAHKNWNDLMLEMSKDPEAYGTLGLGINSETSMHELMDKLMGNKRAVAVREKEKKDAKEAEEKEKKAQDKELNRNALRNRMTISKGVTAGIDSFKSNEEYEMNRNVGNGAVGDKFIGDHTRELLKGAGTKFKDATYAIMRGDAIGAVQQFGSIMADSAKSVWDGVKGSLFGDEEDGSKGLFGGVKEAVSDTYKSIMLRVNGKPFTDSKGEEHKLEDGEKSLTGTLHETFKEVKSSIKYKLFGSDDEDENGEKKEGIVKRITNSLTSGLVGWKQALFGKKAGEKDVEEMTPEDMDDEKKKIKDAIIKTTPKTMLGAGGGALLGALGGSSIMGMMIGGPIGGAILGIGASLLSSSNKFKDWLFGPEIDDGNGTKQRLGGFISANTQNFFKKHKKAIIGGGVLGLIKGMVFPAGGKLGFMTQLLGGPIGGAALGIGFSLLKDSKMFQEFLYGNPEKGKRGILTAITGAFKRKGNNGGGKDEKEKKGILKTLGMGAIGLGGGAAGAALLSKVGIMGWLATPYGPIGGAVLGLSVGLAAGSKKFAKMLFGEKDEDGKRKGGMLQKFTNFMSVEVMNPIKSKLLNWGEDLTHTIKYDVLENIRRPFLLLTDAFKKSFKSVSESILEPIQEAGMTMLKEVVKPIGELAATIFRPVRHVLGKIADIAYTVTKRTLVLPFKIIGKVTSVVTSGIGHLLGGISGAIFGAIKSVTNFVMGGAKHILGGVSNIFLTVAGGLKNFIGDKLSASRQKQGILAKASIGFSRAKEVVGAITGNKNKQDFAKQDIEKKESKAELKRNKQRREDLDANRSMMAQILGYDVKYFTKENMERALNVAKEKGIKVHFKGKDSGKNKREYEVDPEEEKKKLLAQSGPELINTLRKSDDASLRQLAYTMDINQQLKQIQDILGCTRDEAKEFFDKEENVQQRKDDAAKAGLQTNDEGIVIDERDVEKKTVGDKIDEKAAAISNAGGLKNYIRDQFQIRRAARRNADAEDSDESEQPNVANLYNTDENDEERTERGIVKWFKDRHRAHAKGGTAKKGEAIITGDGGKHPEDTSSVELSIPQEDTKIINQGPKGFNVIINGFGTDAKRELRDNVEAGTKAGTEAGNASLKDGSGGNGKQGSMGAIPGSPQNALDMLANELDKQHEEALKQSTNGLESLQLLREEMDDVTNDDVSSDAKVENVHSDNTDADDKEGSYAEMSEKKRAIDKAKEDANYKNSVVKLLENLHIGNNEYHNLFGSLWDKKGIVRVALMGGIAWLTHKLTGWDLNDVANAVKSVGGFLSENIPKAIGWVKENGPQILDAIGDVKDSVVSTVDSIIHNPIIEGIGDKLGDIGNWIKKRSSENEENSKKEHSKSKWQTAADDVKKIGRVGLDVVTLNPIKATKDAVTDENGNWTNRSDSEARLLVHGLRTSAKKGLKSAASIKHGPFKKTRRAARIVNNQYKRMMGAMGSGLNSIKTGYKKGFGEGQEILSKKMAEKAEKKAAQKAAKAAMKEGTTKVAKETGEAVVENAGKKVVTETAQEAAESAVKGTAKKVGTEAVQEAGEAAAKTAVKKVGTEAVQEAGEAALKTGGAKLAQSAVKQTAKEAGEGVAKAAAEKAVGSAAKKGLLSKVIDIVKGGISKFLSVLGEKLGKSAGKGMIGKIKNKVFDKLIKGITKHFPKMSARFSSAIAKDAAGTLFLPAKGVFAIIGALDGASGAKELFETTDVDAIMIAISAAWGALGGLTCAAALIEIAADVLEPFLHFNFFKEACWEIYYFIVGGKDSEKGKKLQEGQKKMTNEWDAKKTKQLQSQYNTLKATGKLDKDVKSFEDFKKQADSGKGKATFIDKKTYINKKHGKVSDKIINGAIEGGKSLKNFVIGAEKYYDPVEKIYYTRVTSDGVDGYLMSYDKYGKYTVGGKDSGLIAKDQVSKDVQKRWKKSHNGLISKKVDFFKGLIGKNDDAEAEAKRRYEADMKTNGQGGDAKLTTKEVKEKVTKTVKKGLNKVKGFVSKLFGANDDDDKSTSKSSTSNTKRKSNTSDKIYYTMDYRGYYKKAADGYYDFYNMNGDKVEGKEVTAKQFQDLIVNSMVIEGNAIDTLGAKKKSNKAVSDIFKNIQAINEKSAESQKSNWGILGTLFESIGIKVESTSKNTSGGKGTGVEINTKKIKNVSGGRGEFESNINQNDTGNNSNAGFTYYSQNDPKWKNDSYVSAKADDGATLGDSGCGPTAMAMVVGELSGKKDITPDKMSQLASTAGFRDETGTNNQFIDYAGSQAGLKSKKMKNPDIATLETASKENPIVLNGLSGNNGPFTESGHYIVAVGHDQAGNIIVNDPRGKEYSTSYSPAELANNTATAWQFSKGDGSASSVIQEQGGGNGFGRRRFSVLGGKGYDDYVPNSIKYQTKNYWGSGGINGIPDVVRSNYQGGAHKGVSSTTQNQNSGINGIPDWARLGLAGPDTSKSANKKQTYQNGDGGIGGVPDAVRSNSGGHATGSNAGTGWLFTVQKVKTAASEQVGYYSKGTRNVNVTIDGKQWVMPRPDCSGFVSLCLKVYGKLPEDSAGYNSSAFLGANVDGFTNQDWPGWDGCMAGDILVRNGHVEIFSRNDGDNHYVYNWGSNSSASKPGETLTGHSREGYTKILRPNDAGSASLTTGSSTSTNTGSSSGGSFLENLLSVITQFGSKAIEGIMTGNWDFNFSLDGSSDSGSSNSSSDSSGSSGADLSNVSLDATQTAKTSYSFFKQRGYSDEAIAGLLGNFQQESGMNAKRIQGDGKGPAAGLVQWESYANKSKRWKEMSDYAESKGRSWEDLNSQLEFIDKELRGDCNDNWVSVLLGKRGGIDAFKQLTDVHQATKDFEETFEQAGKPEMEARYQYADSWYQKIKNGEITQQTYQNGDGGVGGVPDSERYNTGAGIGRRKSRKLKRDVDLHGGNGTGSRRRKSGGYGRKKPNILADYRKNSNNLNKDVNLMGGGTGDAGLTKYHFRDDMELEGGNGKKDSDEIAKVLSNAESKLNAKKTFNFSNTATEINNDVKSELKGIDGELKGGRGIETNPNLDHGNTPTEIKNTMNVIPETFDGSKIEQLLTNVVTLLESINGNTKESLKTGNKSTVIKQGDKYTVNKTADNRKVTNNVTKERKKTKDEILAMQIAKGI